MYMPKTLIELVPHGFSTSLCPMPGKHVQWAEIEKRFSEIYSILLECDQDKIFHPEGDVWTHTKMACDYLVGMPGWQGLSSKERNLLFLSCLFHDIGKPFVSEVVCGRITSPRHSIAGARIFREKCIKKDSGFDFPWHVREFVSSMIMLHTLPFHFVNKKNPQFSVIASSQVVSNNLLYMLGLADIQGRGERSEEMHRDSIDTIAYFPSFCREELCFENARMWLNQDMAFRYLSLRKGSPNVQFNAHKTNTVVMMSGIQGSGKTTVVRRKYSEFPVVGFDQVRKSLKMKFGDNEGTVSQEVKRLLKGYMADDYPTIVFDATNLIKSNRATWAKLFSQYGYRVVIHYVERNLESILADNKSREDSVPEDVILDKIRSMDFPTEIEAHHCIYDFLE